MPVAEAVVVGMVGAVGALPDIAAAGVCRFSVTRRALVSHRQDTCKAP